MNRRRDLETLRAKIDKRSGKTLIHEMDGQDVVNIMLKNSGNLILELFRIRRPEWKFIVAYAAFAALHLYADSYDVTCDSLEGWWLVLWPVCKLTSDLFTTILPWIFIVLAVAVYLSGMNFIFAVPLSVVLHLYTAWLFKLEPISLIAYVVILWILRFALEMLEYNVKARLS